MRRALFGGWVVSLLLAYLAGQSTGPSASAAAQAAAAQQQPAAQQQQQQKPAGPPAAPGGALPPGDYSKMQIAPDAGTARLFSGAEMRKAHEELQKRSGGTRVISNPRDLMAPMVTRTHSYILLHRPEYKSGGPAPTGEQHEGVTDVYFIVAGSGTVTVGGTIENRRISRPGEFIGPINGGERFKVQAGDILNIPINMPHATMPDPGGLTYVLMKVNSGLYPWSLINGTP